MKEKATPRMVMCMRQEQLQEEGHIYGEGNEGHCRLLSGSLEWAGGDATRQPSESSVVCLT